MGRGRDRSQKPLSSLFVLPTSDPSLHRFRRQHCTSFRSFSLLLPVFFVPFFYMGKLQKEKGTRQLASLSDSVGFLSTKKPILVHNSPGWDRFRINRRGACTLSSTSYRATTYDKAFSILLSRLGQIHFVSLTTQGALYVRCDYFPVTLTLKQESNNGIRTENSDT